MRLSKLQRVDISQNAPRSIKPASLRWGTAILRCQIDWLLKPSAAHTAASGVDLIALGWAWAQVVFKALWVMVKCRQDCEHQPRASKEAGLMHETRGAHQSHQHLKAAWGGAPQPLPTPPACW